MRRNLAGFRAAASGASSDAQLANIGIRRDDIDAVVAGKRWRDRA